MLLVLGVAVACGGRTSFLAPDQSDETGGSAGATSQGGKSNAGGKPSRGGNPGVAGSLVFPIAGTGSTLGGTSTGGSPCKCEPLEECAPGYYRASQPGFCCAGGPCLLDCREVGCTDIDLDCQPGMHVGTLPGECCPSCVPDNPPSCETAKKLYMEFRAEALARFGLLGCFPGCAMAGESNRCAVTCGTPVVTVARDALEEELGLFAEATCSACPLPTKPVCLPTPPLSCNVGECTFTPTQ